MKSLTHFFRPRPYSLAFCAILAVGAVVGQRPLLAQSITVDFTVDSATNPTGDINTATALSNTLNLTSGAATTQTVNIWFVITPGSTGVTDDNLGILDAYWAAASSVAYSNGASRATTNIGAGSSTGANTGLGPLTGSIVSPFNSVYSFGGNTTTGSFANGSNNKKGAFGDYSSVGINSVSGTTQATTADFASNGASGGNDELGSIPTDETSGGGEAYGTSATSTGWAWNVGTVTFKLPTVTTGTATVSFAPTSITPFNGTEVSWTDNAQGAYTQLTNQTSSADALQNGLGVTFAIAAAGGGGNTSVLTLKPANTTAPNSTTSISFGNYLVGATVPTQNMTLTESAGVATTYTTSSAPTGFNVTDNNLTPGAITASGSDTFTVGVNTATMGNLSGSYTVSNPNSTATQGNLAVAFTANVGNATPDESGTGSFNGTVLSAPVGTGASYAGLSSSSNGGLKAANTAFPTQPGIEGSVATILAGTNTSFGTGTVSMTWRSRTLGETAQYDAVNNSPFTVNGTKVGGLPLISDVVDLFGMGTNSTQSSTTPVQTDPFVFQESFNPQTLKNEGATNATLATRGNVYLASLVSGAWVNTIIPDFQIPTANTTTTTYNGQTIQIGVDTLASMPSGISRPFEGTFAQWEAAFDPGLANPLSDYIGVWGVDAQTGTQFGVAGDNQYNAWAIINHNSDFAVVPEPSTIVLAGFGLLGGIWAMRRRRGLRLEA